MKRIALGLAVLAVATAAGPAAASVNVWSSGFDSGGYFESTGPFAYNLLGVTFGGGSIKDSDGLPGFGTKTFHNDTSGTTEFYVTELGAHSALQLSFDIALLDSWDGLDGSPSPDILFVDIEGLDSYEFTVNSASGSGANFGPGQILSTGSNLGFSSYNDTIVRYTLQFAHTSEDWKMKIRFGGAGFQGGVDESWAMDNFSLRAVEPGSLVPEPGTWALMIAGFGMAGSALRRRRIATAWASAT